MSGFLDFNESSQPTTKMAFPQIPSSTTTELSTNIIACSLFILAIIFISDNFSRRKQHQALYTSPAGSKSTSEKTIQTYECASSEAVPSKPVAAKQSGKTLSLFDGLSMGAAMALRA